MWKKNCTAARLPVFLSIRCLSHTPLSVSSPPTHTHTDRIAVSSFIKFPNNDLSA